MWQDRWCISFPFGSSDTFIKCAAKQAENCPFGKNLSFRSDKIRIDWWGPGGMKLGQLLPCLSNLVSISACPDVLLLHLDENDLVQLSGLGSIKNKLIMVRLFWWQPQFSSSERSANASCCGDSFWSDEGFFLFCVSNLEGHEKCLVRVFFLVAEMEELVAGRKGSGHCRVGFGRGNTGERWLSHTWKSVDERKEMGKIGNFLIVWLFLSVGGEV